MAHHNVKCSGSFAAFEQISSCTQVSSTLQLYFLFRPTNCCLWQVRNLRGLLCCMPSLVQPSCPEVGAGSVATNKWNLFVFVSRLMPDRDEFNRRMSFDLMSERDFGDRRKNCFYWSFSVSKLYLSLVPFS